MQRVAGELETSRHGAQFVHERRELLVEPRTAFDPLAYELQPLVEQPNAVERVVERTPQAVLPNRILRKSLGESDDRLTRFVHHELEQIEEQRALVAHGVDRRRKPRVHEVEAGRAEQVVARREPTDERRQQSAATSLETIEQTLK